MGGLCDYCDCRHYTLPMSAQNTLAASGTAMACLAATLIVLIWSGIASKERGTWLMAVAPVWIALPLVLMTWRRFPLTTLITVVITLHAIVLMVGGKYTYAEMPLFDWIRDEFHLSRNHYDRLGHFMQGLEPALVIRELLLRTSPPQLGKWFRTWRFPFRRTSKASGTCPVALASQCLPVAGVAGGLHAGDESRRSERFGQFQNSPAWQPPAGEGQ